MKRSSVKVDNSSNMQPFEVSGEKPFNVAQLLSVEMHLSDKEDAKPCIRMVFGDMEEEMIGHVHYEFIPKESEKNPIVKQMERQDFRIAHLYDTFMGYGANKKAGLNGTPIGTVFTKDEAGNLVLQPEAEYEDFFKSIVESFNTGRNGKPVFLTEKGEPIPVWIKLTYDNKGRLQFPLYNNFASLYTEGKAPVLSINPAYDVVEKPKNLTPTAPGTVTNTAVNPAKPKFKF